MLLPGLWILSLHLLSIHLLHHSCEAVVLHLSVSSSFSFSTKAIICLQIIFYFLFFCSLNFSLAR